MRLAVLTLMIGLLLAGGVSRPATGDPIPLVPVAALTAPPATDSASDSAIESITRAADPSAAIDAYAKAVAAEPGRIIDIQKSYIRRMIEFGAPELAETQAQDLVFRDPHDGVAWAVLAHANGRRARTTAALGQIEAAVQRAPDDVFVQRTAGQLLAWYDTQTPTPQLPDSIAQGLQSTRQTMQGREAFTQAYQAARNAYSQPPPEEQTAPPPATTYGSAPLYDPNQTRMNYGPVYDQGDYYYPPPSYPAYDYYYPPYPAYYGYSSWPYFWSNIIIVDGDHHHHDHHGNHHDDCLVPRHHGDWNRSGRDGSRNGGWGVGRSNRDSNFSTASRSTDTRQSAIGRRSSSVGRDNSATRSTASRAASGSRTRADRPAVRASNAPAQVRQSPATPSRRGSIGRGGSGDNVSRGGGAAVSRGGGSAAGRGGGSATRGGGGGGGGSRSGSIGRGGGARGGR